MRGALLGSAAWVLAAAATACVSRDACPRFAGAAGDGVCACGDGAILLDGACVSTHTADAYCGRGARFTGGACAFRECPDEQALDIATGECVPTRALREIAAAQQIVFAIGERLVCEGGKPIVDGDDLACVANAALCPRGARFANGACVAATRCRPGEIATHDGKRCTSLLTRKGDAHVVDVASWARAVFGSDGGAGSAELCAPLALRPRAFADATRASASASVVVRVELRFPNRDVADVRATIASEDLPARAAAVLDETTRPLVRVLQAFGGESSAAAVHLAVRCTVDPPERPHPSVFRSGRR